MEGGGEGGGGGLSSPFKLFETKNAQSGKGHIEVVLLKVTFLFRCRRPGLV